MVILRHSPSVPRSDPAPAELAAALARLCEREGLDASETAGVLAMALTWPPSRPRDPMPLLRGLSQISDVHGSLGMAAEFVTSDIGGGP
jgi:hypothetical protein